jgi:hypothetical protein
MKNFVFLFLFSLMGSSGFAQDLEMRSYHVYLEELVGLKTWDTKKLSDLTAFADFVEKRLPAMRLQPDAAFFDVRPLIEMDLGESGFAIWNEETRVLTIRGPAEALEKLDENLQGWTVDEDRPMRIAIEAICVRAHSPPDPSKLLAGQPTLQQLLADGMFGKPELVHVSAVRSTSGHRAKTEAKDLPQVTFSMLEVDPVSEPGGIVIDLNLNYELMVRDGPTFNQATSFTLSSDHPMVLQLGGSGTPADPAYFLVVRAWSELADGEEVEH